MYSTPTNNPEPHPPTSSQYPLRPASRVSPIRINVLKSLRLHPVSSLLVALLVLGVGLAVIAKHKPNYVSTSVIYVSPVPINNLVQEREQGPYDSFVQETIHDIDRYEILAEAIHRLPPGIWQYPGEPERSAVQRLQNSLDISRVGQTYQVEISIEGTRPEHLADIVNTVTAVYLEKAKSEEFYDRGGQLSSLKNEEARIQQRDNALLEEQDQISKALGMASVNSKDPSTIDADNAKIQGELLSARAQRIAVEAQLDALTNGDPSAPNSALSVAADELIANDPQLLALKTQLSQHQADLVSRLNGMTEANPDRKQAEAELAQTEKALQEMQSNLRRQAANRLEQKLRTQLNQAQIVEAKLNNDLQRGTRQATDTAPKIQRAQEIQAELDRLQTRYAAVEDRISNLQLESSAPGSVHLFAPALPPLGPEKSKVRILLLAIGPVSLIFGILSAILFDLLDPHIYTATDVEAVLGFAPIGMLFDDREVTQAVFDECALRLAAGVEHAARLAGARTFLMTAVNSGAGTTSITESLGGMLAKLGRKTLLIDPSGNSEPVALITLGSDLLRRPVHFPEGATAGAGSSAELQKLKTGTSAFPTQMARLNSSAFDSFQNMTAEYDIVLIDAAPLLLSAQTEYLARMTDVTVLISEAGKTKKSTLLRAARLLERLGVAGAAAVVNKVHPARVEEALKGDLREFEMRSDRINLREWWKPNKKTPPASAASFGKGETEKGEEELSYAREI